MEAIGGGSWKQVDLGSDRWKQVDRGSDRGKQVELIVYLWEENCCQDVLATNSSRLHAHPLNPLNPFISQPSKVDDRVPLKKAKTLSLSGKREPIQFLRGKNELKKKFMKWNGCSEVA